MPYKNFKKTEIIDEIGSELHEIRISKKLTLYQVAEALESNSIHLSSTMLYRIETGERRIDDTILLSLCNYYQINPNSLIIRACQKHINKLLEENDDTQSLNEEAKSESQTIADMYLNLPSNRQADVRTMMRMLAYMEKISK